MISEQWSGMLRTMSLDGAAGGVLKLHAHATVYTRTCTGTKARASCELSPPVFEAWNLA